MAQYQVEHSCGCVKTYQLYGPTKERHSRIAWLETQECPDCRRERENAENAKKAEEAGRPELTGSEKQVAWANTIREKAVHELQESTKDGLLKTHNAHLVVIAIKARLRAENKGDDYVMSRGKEIVATLGDKKQSALIAMLLDTVNDVTDSRDWIDNRSDAIAMLADLVAVKLIGVDVDKTPQTLKDDQFGRCKNGSYYLRTHGFAESTDQDVNTELAFVDADDVTDNGDGTITIAGDVLQAAIDRAGARTSANYGTFCNVYLNKSKK
ncbi:MAG: hypothetical protein IJG38_03925 [Thermoguttaceae bacterium]|nr:hypothetical protein [Thermoguttaceae bacterium]